jgi:hypothetical protein
MMNLNSKNLVERERVELGSSPQERHEAIFDFFFGWREVPLPRMIDDALALLGGHSTIIFANYNSDFKLITDDKKIDSDRPLFQVAFDEVSRISHASDCSVLFKFNHYWLAVPPRSSAADIAKLHNDCIARRRELPDPKSAFELVDSEIKERNPAWFDCILREHLNFNTEALKDLPTGRFLASGIPVGFDISIALEIIGQIAKERACSVVICQSGESLVIEPEQTVAEVAYAWQTLQEDKAAKIERTAEELRERFSDLDIAADPLEALIMLDHMMNHFRGTTGEPIVAPSDVEERFNNAGIVLPKKLAGRCQVDFGANEGEYAKFINDIKEYREKLEQHFKEDDFTTCLKVATEAALINYLHCAVNGMAVFPTDIHLHPLVHNFPKKADALRRYLLINEG